MPVFDYTYRTYRGTRRGPAARVLAIPKFTWMDMGGRKVFIWLFTLAWVQFVARVAYMYALVNVDLLVSLEIPVNILPRIDAKFFKIFIDIQVFFCFGFAFLLGAGLIARDMRHNAAVLIYSKPINVFEYFAGKFLAIFLLMMAVTWLQATLLYGLQCVITPDHSEWRLYPSQHTGFPVAILLYSNAVSGVVSLMIMAASSLTANPRYAGTAFVMYLVGSSICAGVTAGVLGNADWLVLSPFYSIFEFGTRIFGVEGDGPATTLGKAGLGLGFTAALCGVILWWRLRKAARQAH